MKLLILWFLVAASAGAATWQRHVFTPKGDFLDTPVPHPLAYFTRDPFLRDDGYDFCTSCTPEDKAAVHSRLLLFVAVRRGAHRNLPLSLTGMPAAAHYTF